MIRIFYPALPPRAFRNWFALAALLLLPVAAWSHGEIEGAGEEKTVRIVDSKSGRYRLELSLSPSLPVAGEDANMEIKAVRLLAKPDPLLGSEVPVTAKPVLSVLEESSHKVLASSVDLHDEGEAGVSGADQFHFPASGSLMLRFQFRAGDATSPDDFTVDFPVSVKTNVAAIFRLFVNLAITFLILGLAALELWKIRARGGEPREMAKPAAIGAICWVAAIGVMNYFVLDRVLALRKPPGGAAPAAAVKVNDDGSFTIPSPVQKTLGIELVAARELPLEQTLAAAGTIQAKPENTADVVAPLWGRIEFSKNALAVGDHVDKAQELVKVILELSQVERAPMEAKQTDIRGALAKAKDRRDAAKIELDRAQKLFDANPAYEQDLKWAKELYDEANNTWQQIDKEDKGYVGVIKFRDPRKTPVYAPIAGTITYVGFTPGQLDLNGEFLKLFTIVDTSTVWARADVFASDVWKLKAGEAVVVHPAGHPEISLQGSIRWIGDTMDPATRTVPVLADIPNPNRELAIGGFVQVEFSTHRQKAVAVPEQAVIDDGSSKRIYVSVGGEKFQPVDVEVGVRKDGWWQVLSGVDLGDSVVTKGVALLGAMRPPATVQQSEFLAPGEKSAPVGELGSLGNPSAQPPTQHPETNP